MDRWGRITGTPLVLPPAKTKQGAVAGYPRRMPQTARALAFAPATGGAPAQDAVLETAGVDATSVTAPTSPETSMRKVLHSGHWAVAAVGESTEGPEAPVHEQAKDQKVQLELRHSPKQVQIQVRAIQTPAELTGGCLSSASPRSLGAAALLSMLRCAVRLQCKTCQQRPCSLLMLCLRTG